MKIQALLTCLFRFCLLAAVIVFTLGVIQPAWAVVGPPNVLTNSTFATDMSGWTNIEPDIWSWNSGHIEATLGAGQYAVAYQKIKILTPPAGDSWTISVNGSSTIPFQEFRVILYSDNACTNAVYSDFVNLNSGASNTFTVAGIHCAAIEIRCQGPDTCTADDVFLGGTSATQVSLSAFQSAPNRSKSAWLALSGLLVLGGAVSIWRRRFQA